MKLRVIVLALALTGCGGGGGGGSVSSSITLSSPAPVQSALAATGDSLVAGGQGGTWVPSAVANIGLGGTSLLPDSPHVDGKPNLLDPDRLRQAVGSEVLYVLAGSNDLYWGRSADDLIRGAQKFEAECGASRVVWLTVPYRTPQSDAQRAQTDLFNEWILTRDHVDIRPVFRSTYDGIHPDAATNQLIQKAVFP